MIDTPDSKLIVVTEIGLGGDGDENDKLIGALLSEGDITCSFSTILILEDGSFILGECEVERSVIGGLRGRGRGRGRGRSEVESRQTLRTFRLPVEFLMKGLLTIDVVSSGCEREVC